MNYHRWWPTTGPPDKTPAGHQWHATSGPPQSCLLGTNLCEYKTVLSLQCFPESLTLVGELGFMLSLLHGLNSGFELFELLLLFILVSQGISSLLIDLLLRLLELLL